MTEKLMSIIYSSSATAPFNQEDLIKLLTLARKNNSSLGLTGVLLYTQGSFFQVLEGSDDSVNSIFEIIKNDKRHHSFTKIIHEPIPKRHFGDWSMGFLDMDNTSLEKIEGFNDFYQNKNFLLRMDMSRARKLLQAFSEGHWHNKIV